MFVLTKLCVNPARVIVPCPCPLQAATIPLMLRNKDVAVEAVSRSGWADSTAAPCTAELCLQVTGSGKTLAFVIPVVETLLSK